MICVLNINETKWRRRKMNEIENDFELAQKAMKKAHEPYSDYKVGAVLTAKSGKQYTGCNIANHGIQSICAERVAFVKAISEGERTFERIVIVGGDENNLEECLPCGYCRQFISEFVDEKFKIYAWNGKGGKCYSISELLPYGFQLQK